jgi:hypothetical protein
MYMARECEKLRKSNPKAQTQTLVFSKIYIIDYDSEHNSKTLREEVINLDTTPAIMFYNKSKAMVIRRDGYSDSNLFLGSVKREKLIKLFNQTKKAAKDNIQTITL